MAAAQFRYRAFGLNISSQIELAELIPAPPGPIALTIRRVPVAWDLSRAGATAYDWSPGEQRMLWPAVGRFTIHGTSAIDVEPTPGVEDRLLAFPLLGPVMALVNHLRGCLVLHGSGIAVNGRGVIFLGDKMAGKSTLAAAFVASGHQLLSDDVIAISGLDAARPVIEPAFPQLKLSDAASNLLAETSCERWPEVLPGFPKRQHRLTDSAMPADIVPALVLVLVRGMTARIERIDAGEVLGALMHNSYVKKFIGRTLSQPDGARHLAQVASLANSCTVARLEVPDSIDRLGEVVELIEREVGAHGGAVG